MHKKHIEALRKRLRDLLNSHTDKQLFAFARKRGFLTTRRLGLKEPPPGSFDIFPPQSLGTLYAILVYSTGTARHRKHLGNDVKGLDYALNEVRQQEIRDISVWARGAGQNGTLFLESFELLGARYSELIRRMPPVTNATIAAMSLTVRPQAPVHTMTARA
ncbi:MAG: hypothetical protein V4481_00350 [Patescibacteria group bacterium]